MSTRNICWEISRPCVRLTTLLPSCANCLYILGTSKFCKTRCLSRPVKGFLHLFVNIEDVMELRYFRMKMGLMYSTEGFYTYKGTTSNNQVRICTKLKEHLDCSSWINIRGEPSRVTSMVERNFVQIFSPNIYHDNLFEKGSSWNRTFRHWCSLLIIEFKQTNE